MEDKKQKTEKTVYRPSPAYAVGYGRPPQTSRFKKGRSGNPKGRPKTDTRIGTFLRHALAEEVRVTESGETSLQTREAAMLLTLWQRAVQGNASAARQIIQLLEKFGMLEDVSDRPRTGVVAVRHPWQGLPVEEIRRKWKELDEAAARAAQEKQGGSHEQQ